MFSITFIYPIVSGQSGNFRQNWSSERLKYRGQISRFPYVMINDICLLIPFHVTHIFTGGDFA